MISAEDTFSVTDEPELIRLFFSRDEAALEQTEARYGAYCYQIVYGILRDFHDAKECENDVYMELWRRIPPSVPTCFRTFLGRIARFRAIDFGRKKEARRSRSSDVLLVELAEVLPADVDPVREVLFAELCDMISRFLQDLPNELRIFFVQRYWYAMETKEIAKLHGCEDGKVRMALCRVRNDLRAYLEREGYSV